VGDRSESRQASFAPGLFDYAAVLLYYVQNPVSLCFVYSSEAFPEKRMGRMEAHVVLKTCIMYIIQH